MVAEGRALLDDLRLAILLKIPISVIYTDSLALVELLKDNRSPPWSFLPWWHKLKEIFSITQCPIVHTYRDTNMLADALANHAIVVGHNTEFASTRELPLIVTGAAIADVGSIPNIHIRHV